MFFYKFVIISLIFKISFGQIIHSNGYNYENNNKLSNVTPHVENAVENFTNSKITENNMTRIIGGSPLNIDQVPFQVALFKNGKFVCGGSLITADWVLTAAHCVADGGNFIVRAGSRNIKENGQTRRSVEVIVNSGFNRKSLNHDIAMILVAAPFNLNRNVKAVRIARPNMNLPTQYLVSGWGSTSEGKSRPEDGLRGAVVKGISESRCRRQYKGIKSLSKFMICASSPGKDACQGDSGGPLTSNGIQYGIVSFGIGCGRSAYPGIYTNIRREYNWINRNVKRYGGSL